MREVVVTKDANDAEPAISRRREARPAQKRAQDVHFQVSSPILHTGTLTLPQRTCAQDAHQNCLTLLSSVGL